MSDTTQPLTIVGLQVENVKRLQAVAITPKPGLNCIGGANAQGKTSLLDAIAMVLGGKSEMPDVPLRTGAEKGRIDMTLSDGLRITRKITGKGTVLEVTNAAGFKASSPQEIVNKLTSSRMFDPLAFTRAKPAERVATLKALVGLKTEDLDVRRKALYDQRTLVNKQATAASYEVAASPRFDNAPAEEVDPADIYAKIKEADAANEATAKLRREHADAIGFDETITTAIAVKDRRAEELRAELSRIVDQSTLLRKQRDENKAKIVDLAAKVEAAVTIDTSSLKAELGSVADVNRCVQANRRRAELEAKARKIEAEADTLTAEIGKVDAEAAARLAAVKFPIEGLAFSDSDVLFNGVPLAQASGAEAIKVSVAIGAALNPQLKACLIRDGSLLDDRSLNELGMLCFEHGLQLFVERVGEGEECSVIIEDGKVKETA